MKQIFIAILTAGTLAAVLLLSGCPASVSGGAYSRSEVRQASEVETGTVVSVRPVQIEGTSGVVGTAGGAAIGGIAGSNIGRGSKTHTIGAIGGALLGGLLGAAAEEGVTRRQGLEITVRLDSGRTIAITQGADEQFYSGDRVRIVTSSDGATRVSH